MALSPQVLALISGALPSYPGSLGGGLPKLDAMGSVMPQNRMFGQSSTTAPAAGAPPSMRNLAEDPATAFGNPRPRQRGLAGFFDRVINPTNALGEFGKALVMAGGGPVGGAFSILDQQHQATVQAQVQRAKDMREEERYGVERQDKLDERDWQRNKPDIFSGGADRLKYDPATGTITTLYDAPTREQDYVAALELEQGTPEADRALQDYVLRGNGPTALEGDLALEGARYGHRRDLKGVPTYRDRNPRPPGSLGGGTRTTGNVYAPILAKVARGEPLSGGEQRVLDMYNRGGKGRGRSKAATGAPGDGATATGPNGKKIVLRGGRWVPLN